MASLPGRQRDARFAGKIIGGSRPSKPAAAAGSIDSIVSENRTNAGDEE